MSQEPILIALTAIGILLGVKILIASLRQSRAKQEEAPWDVQEGDCVVKICSCKPKKEAP